MSMYQELMNAGLSSALAATIGAAIDSSPDAPTEAALKDALVRAGVDVNAAGVLANRLLSSVGGSSGGSATALQTKLASTAVGDGAAIVSYNPNDATAPKASLSAYIHVRREKFNVMDAVPVNEREAITAMASNYDTLPHFMEALDYFGTPSSACQGLIEVPRGLFKISGKIPLRFETSLKGLAGRASRIQTTGDFSAIGWDAAIPSFSRQVSITDLWVIGAGKNSGGTVSCGIDIDHPWGIDFLTLKRLWLEDFPQYCIRTNQPASGSGGSGKNCFQFADWDSLYMRNSNSGLLFGYGFSGESSLSNICSQFMTTSCVDFTVNPALTGPQGLNLVNLAGGWAPYGVRMLNGTAGNIKFDMLHMESCTTAAFYMNSPNINKVILESPWLAKNTKAFLGDLGGHVFINNGTWQGAGNATDTFIKCNAPSNFVINLGGQHTIVAPVSGSAPTDHISVPDMSVVRGAVQRKSGTAGTINSAFTQNLFMQTRGICGELATVPPANFSGSAAIANGATSVAVTFPRQEADTNYRIGLTIDWGIGTPSAWAHNVQMGNKTLAGFTATFGVAAPAAGAALNWTLTR